MDSRTLRAKIQAELEWEPSVEAASIGVGVENGKVTLTGHVRTLAEKFAAERAVMRVRGVKAIVEEIEVRPPEAYSASDDDIASRALTLLALDIAVPEDAITVMVQDGRVTLTGEVDWQYQRVAAEDDIRKLRGVRGMSNLITVKSRDVPPDAEARIKDALLRSAARGASNLRVSIADGKATLEGSVETWAERQTLENAVWAAPGVKEVDSRLSHKDYTIGGPTRDFLIFGAMGLVIALILIYYFLRDVLHF